MALSILNSSGATEKVAVLAARASHSSVYMDGVVQEVNARALGKGWNCCLQIMAG